MDNCEIAPKYIDVTDFIVTGIWSYFSASKIIPAGDLPAVVKEIKIGAIDIDIDWDRAEIGKALFFKYFEDLWW